MIPNCLQKHTLMYPPQCFAYALGPLQALLLNMNTKVLNLAYV